MNLIFKQIIIYFTLLDKLKLKNIPLDVKKIENCPFNNQGEAMVEFVFYTIRQIEHADFTLFVI